MRLHYLAAAALAACAGTAADPTEPMPPAIEAAARGAWLASGHRPPKCEAPRLEHVELADFAALCERPSCADPAVTPATPVCAHACTLLGVTPEESVVFFAGLATVASGRELESPRAILAHETYHAWRDCTYSDPDYAHAHGETWVTAMDLIRAGEAKEE
jgi:hypothetical protein